MPEENDPFGGPPPVDDPFGKDPTPEQNLSVVRNQQFQELRDNPQLLGDLFSLVHNEVGTQGQEAQQAFIETIFNRAAARRQTLDQAMHDKGYYPKVSLKAADISGEAIDHYGTLLSQVGQGSNISNGATGNASGRVRFAGGPQTFESAGERFGIEGPDVGKTPAPSTGEPIEDPFGKPAPSATPAPLPGPASTPTLADNQDSALMSFVQGFTGPEGIQQFIPKSVGQAGQMITGSFMPFLETPQAVEGAVSAINRLVTTGQFPQPQGPLYNAEIAKTKFGRDSPEFKAAAGKAAGTILPQMAMAALGVKGLTPKPAVPAVPPLTDAVKGSGKFRATYQIDKTLGDMMESLGASKESGALRGEIAVRNLTTGLDKQQVADLGNYLVSERLGVLKGIGRIQDHPQILPAPEMQRIASDPKVRSAIDQYRADVEPAIEDLHLRAGTNPDAIAAQRGAYIPLIKSETAVPKKYGSVQQAGRLSKKTRFAKQATGAAQEYNTNVSDLIREAFQEATKKARLREFYKEANSKGLAEPVVQYGPEGKVYSDFNDKSFDQGTPEGQTLLNQLRAATETPHKPSGPVMKGIRALQRGSTTIALSANPAEILNHMRRQLNVVSAKPPVGKGLIARLEAIVPYIGPKAGTFARTIFRNADSPEFQATLQDIFDAGGGSSRSFQNMYELQNPIAKYTGLKWLQNKTHKMLFGIPEGKGFNGFDLRMRVALEDIRRAAEGNKDPQRIREFANQIGQYGAHPDWIINAVKQINPYAGTSLPMRWTEMKQAIGLSGLKEGFMMRRFRQAETLLRGTGGTVIGLAAANYLLSGKWPWENDPGHEFDLNTGVRSTDGKKVYVKFRVIAPELSRPVNTAGLPVMARERAASKPDYLGAFLSSLANAGLSLVGGPAQNAFLTATTGKVPYMVKSPGRAPELMDVAQEDKTKKGYNRGLEQLKQAAISLNPLAEGIIPSNAKRHDVELPGALKYLERPVAGFHGVKPFGDVFTQSYEKKRPKHPQTIAQRAATIRRTRRKQAQAGR